MKREGWESFLHQYILDAQNINFQWGVNDCCLWAGTFYDNVTNSNTTGDWVGTYSDEIGAHEKLLEAGFTDNKELATSIAGNPIRVKLAQRGDIVEYKEALGICTGVNSFFLTPSRGLQRVSTMLCTTAWRV